MPILKHARAAAAIVPAVAAAFAFSSGAHRARAESVPEAGNAIASQALLDLDTYQGQCYTWMQRVVSAAIGVDVGNDYRQGYLDAGFVEVSLADADLGDIIQIDDDSDTDGSSEFPGLHTLIVLQNLGDGTFTGVDANQNLDGMVRFRENYDPAAMAARYDGASFHVYRYSGTPSHPRTHVVAPGDTLNQIAAFYGVTAGVIASINHIADVNLIVAGAVLRIPGEPAASAAEAPASPPAAAKSYTVEEGDTLFLIARHFGLPMAKLQAANLIADPDFIVAGATLVIP